MKSTASFSLFVVLGFALLLVSPDCTKGQSEKNGKAILIFTKTEGYRHASIPDGVDIVKSLGSEIGVRAHHTENANMFNSDSLARYDGIVFLNTTGNILNEDQQKAFQEFIHNGGGFMGVHAATDTEYNWKWYGAMVGAYFKGHPPVQEGKIIVADADHPSTSFLPDSFSHRDEWYNFRNINPEITVLLKLNESSYKGGTNGKNHPIAWYHEFEGGRSFYTGMGHTRESYSQEYFQKHLLGGLQYILQIN